MASETATPTGELELTIESSVDQETYSVTTDENGRFEYKHPSFPNTGPHTLTAVYAGGEHLSSGTAGIAFQVAAPTLLILKGPKGVRDGESFELTGTLLQRNGRAVPDAEVQVGGEEPLTLVTDAEGRFAWETVGELDESLADKSSESSMFIEVAFAGTDHLGPGSATLEVAVGLPRIVVEPLDPVARGSDATLRGTVLVGNRPIANVPVTVGQDASLKSNEIGAFTYDYHVSPDLPLGEGEILVSAEELGATVAVSIEIMSSPSLTFAQSKEAGPDGSALLSATLLDDKGAGVPQAKIRSSQGMESVTDDQGVALVEVAIPDTEEPAVLPLTFTFDGDSRNMPLTSSFYLAIEPPHSGFNWLLWVGLPALMAASVAATLARRRLMALFATDAAGRVRAAVGRTSQSAPLPAEPEPAEGSEVEALQQVKLELDFIKTAADLPEVWGVGEVVSATVRLTNWEGQGLDLATVAVSPGGIDEPSLLVTDEMGKCGIDWTAGAPGEYRVSAEFLGDDVHLPASISQPFRVVDFREEIVFLYNAFLDWAGGKTSGITEQSTPREVELLLVSEGVPVDQKSLDELISRFEEADYSEHPISRRHYEAMYRAWRTVGEA